MFTVLNADGKQTFAEHLAPHSDKERAAESLSQSLTGLKNLTHLPHHPASGPRVYTRAEITALVFRDARPRSICSVLIGELVVKKPG